MRLITFLEAVNNDMLGGGAGVLVFIPNTGRILVQIRGEHPDDKDSGKYDLFGGTLEEGETSEECARREAKEEGGLEFPEGGLEEVGTFSSTEGGDWDGEPYHVFLSIQKQEFPVKVDKDEVDKAGWIEPDVINDKNATNRLVKVLQHEKLAGILHEKRIFAQHNNLIEAQEDDGGWWYHVTSLARMPSIASQGLDPRISGQHFGGGYGGHSAGRTFFATDPESAEMWFNRVQETLEASSDNPYVQTAVILRVHTEYFEEQGIQPEIDTSGTREVADSQFVTVPVPSNEIEVWTPGDQWNPRGWHPAGTYHEQPNPMYGHNPYDYQELDPDYFDDDDMEQMPEWEASMMEAAYPYHGHPISGDWYHGMASSSRAFVRPKGNTPSNIGIWLTNNQDIAVKFSEQAARRIAGDVPVLVTANILAENPMVFDTYRDYLEMWREYGSSDKMRRALGRKGLDSIIIAMSDTDFGGEPRMDLAVFKTSEIRVTGKEKMDP